ncbi:protein kinase domain-containing protein [Nonomuraea sp. NPDC002799]
MPEPLTLHPEDPAAVGPYRLIGRLGTGGQGVVYAGRGPGGALVAVKLLHPHLIADDEALARFLREVRTAKRVAPFCTAQMLDSGFVGARPYIVSEFVDGPSLQESVKESGPRGAAALQRLAINTATALAAIHAAGVVHKDFKPGNVLLGPDGPVVIDFGIAVALDLSQSVVSSQPIGSPAYMAPEQIAGGDVGPPADLFAWAATMYYAATGLRAFGGDNIPATLHAVLQSEPDLSHFEGPLRRLLQDCLAKDRARRPTAAQVVEHLRALPAPTWQDAATGTPTGHPPALKSSGRRGFAVAAATAALILAAGIGISVYALSPATAQRQAAAPTADTSVPPSASPSTTTTAPTIAPMPTARELTAKKMPDKATDLVPASPSKTPRRSTATPTRDRDSTPGSSPTTAPKTPKATPKSTRQSSSSKATPSKTTAGKPSVQPSTGTVTWTDASAYCKAQANTTLYNGNWSNMTCMGTDVQVTVTALCQWKYPAYSNAVGDAPANTFAPTANCALA